MAKIPDEGTLRRIRSSERTVGFHPAKTGSTPVCATQYCNSSSSPCCYRVMARYSLYENGVRPALVRFLGPIVTRLAGSSLVGFWGYSSRVESLFCTQIIGVRIPVSPLWTFLGMGKINGKVHFLAWWRNWQTRPLQKRMPERA